MRSKFLVRTIWDISVRNAEGRVVGTSHSGNLVPDAALDELLTVFFGQITVTGGGGQDATVYIITEAGDQIVDSTDQPVVPDTESLVSYGEDPTVYLTTESGDTITDGSGNPLVPDTESLDTWVAPVPGTAGRDWHIALWGSDTPLSSDATYAVPGYTEIVDGIVEATRPLWVAEDAASQAMGNTVTKAVVAFNAPLTIYGASLVGAAAAEVATKGDVSAIDAVLYAGSSFPIPIDVVDGTSMEIQCIVTSADDGV